MTLSDEDLKHLRKTYIPQDLSEEDLKHLRRTYILPKKWEAFGVLGGMLAFLGLFSAGVWSKAASTTADKFTELVQKYEFEKKVKEMDSYLVDARGGYDQVVAVKNAADQLLDALRETAKKIEDIVPILSEVEPVFFTHPRNSIKVGTVYLDNEDRSIRSERRGNTSYSVLRKEVTFPEGGFHSSPQVYTAVSRFNFKSDADVKMQVRAERVSEASFVAVIETWSSGKLHSAELRWIAFGAPPNPGE